MKKPNKVLMNRNIFLVIERYLANPTDASKSKVKELSHSLADEAYEAYKTRNPDKRKADGTWNIGADEYQKVLLEMMELLAKEAAPYSVRMIYNPHVIKYSKDNETLHEPQYIFRLSKAQAVNLNAIKQELMAEQKHPDGLIFAYDGYIERRAAPGARFKYYEGTDALVLDYTAKLYQKASNLRGREFRKEANILTGTASAIQQKMRHATDPQKYQKISTILEKVKNNPLIQTHRGLKSLLANFLLMLSVVGVVYLTATANKRGTFWYHPNTDSEKAIIDFKENLETSNPNQKYTLKK